MVIEARLKIRHAGCWTEQLTGRQHATMLGLDHERCVAVMHGETEEEVDAFVETRATDYEDAQIVDRGPLSVVVRCRPQPGGIIMTVFAHGCSILWPATYSNGHETYNILAPTRERLGGLVSRLRDLGNVTVERVSEVPVNALSVAVPIADLTSGLTQRQLTALDLAVKSGYYDSPRRTSAEWLARASGLSRSTFQEHLRKAERHVLERFAGVLSAHPVLASATTKGPGRPKKQPALGGEASEAPATP